MSRIALKIDVDTDRGTLEGVPRLAALLERLQVHATFLFSLGPDQTGRAVRRAFRRGFLGKVRRTSVVRHYGLKTLLYGTLLPGPHIGRRRGSIMREIARRGFEVGVHTYNHVRWQDRVATATEPWTRRELTLAHDQFIEIFAQAPHVHGAAGWQMNQYVPALERDLGFRYASDARGDGPFLPVVNGQVIDVLQMPTTLPTLDELIGREDLENEDPVEHLFTLCERPVARDHVYTLHAELEGGLLMDAFERLLQGWQTRGMLLCDLAAYAASVDRNALPRCAIVSGSVAGRSGTLACQASAPAA
ncbi:MAG TPA: polysaccharide deacetylase family protein [Steroidobacteraceae bacterium]